MDKLITGRIDKFLILFAMLIFYACTKNETDTVNVPQPKACFTAFASDPFNNYGWPDTTTYRDFYYYFKNCSDSGEKITYHWDFGDGTSSTEKNPKHIYATRGLYNVTLKVTNQGSVPAITVTPVKVISGQRNIDLGDNINLVPMAFEEIPNNEFVVLGKDVSSGTSYLFYLDSMLRKKSVVTFTAGIRLYYIKATADANYILTGSTQNLDKPGEIIKIKPDGSILWSKTIHPDDSYNFVSPTSDGGYYLVGSRSIPDVNGNIFYKTVVVKTDNNGTKLWDKVFEEENMRQTADAVIEQDGIVLAGVKPGDFGTCNNCDSALVVKLGNDGNKLWASAMTWGLSNYNMWDTRIAKLPNGNYVVINQALTALLFFSNSGVFLDRKLTPYQVNAVTISDDGSIVNLMTKYGNGFMIYLNKMNTDGFEAWNAYADGRQVVPGGFSCCSNSSPVDIRSVSNGGTVSIGYRILDNKDNSGYHEAIVLIPLDEGGNLK